MSGWATNWVRFVPFRANLTLFRWQIFHLWSDLAGNEIIIALEQTDVVIIVVNDDTLVFRSASIRGAHFHSHARFGLKMGQIGTNGNHSGTVLDKIAVHFGSPSENILTYDQKIRPKSDMPEVEQNQPNVHLAGNQYVI